MNQIIIVGTTPPCPRCELLTKIVERKIESLMLDADVRHISYTSEEASEIAAKVGLKPGTAGDVAELIGKEINLENMPKTDETAELDFHNNTELDLKQYDGLFRSVNTLDNLLKPYENQAKKVGILMTPVLVINGTIQYNGSVPDLALIDGWLSKLK